MKQIALLYSVVLGPERRLKSTELLALAESAGLTGARTVVSTGNLVFDTAGTSVQMEMRLEQAVATLFGRLIPVFVRNETEWRAMVAENPFPRQTEADPTRVAVRVLRSLPPPALVDRIAARAAPGEGMALRGRSLWIACPDQMSASPLFRAAGADWAGEGTFRNASAVQRIAAALD